MKQKLFTPYHDDLLKRWFRWHKTSDKQINDIAKFFKREPAKVKQRMEELGLLQ